MASIALLFANANYSRESDLPCCLNDLAAIEGLVGAIGRYDETVVIADADADRMRESIRLVLEPNKQFDEVFFYFSGHGVHIASDFFYCGTSFDSSRPNETGLSHTELHELLRSLEPALLVKVVDACASGTPLVKSAPAPLPLKKEGFRNVIQLASSLEEQESFGGDTLSVFTRAFCRACLRKSDGPIYYSDIIHTLRDDFLQNDEQTPYFVSQGTGREILVDDAEKLAPFRVEYGRRWEAIADIEVKRDSQLGELTVDKPRDVLQLLARSEENMADAKKASNFISSLFDGVLIRFKQDEFSDFFETEKIEHSSFQEIIAREFIIRVLSKENRQDNFVTASITKTRRKPSIWDVARDIIDPQFYEEWDLQLNCELDRAQLRLTLTPLYRSLQRLVLVVTCAPSLENCYVFELATQHERSDWTEFSVEGREIIRRWYKMDWDDSTTSLVEKICSAFESAVRKHIEGTIERLEKSEIKD